ncbi:MAG: hypothetical protein KQJ78_07100 [Deltaproteobacteria bacterium]|nr:hypothetical protein [Deltaproteobacteria bacterium]
MRELIFTTGAAALREHLSAGRLAECQDPAALGLGREFPWFVELPGDLPPAVNWFSFQLPASGLYAWSLRHYREVAALAGELLAAPGHDDLPPWMKDSFYLINALLSFGRKYLAPLEAISRLLSSQAPEIIYLEEADGWAQGLVAALAQAHGLRLHRLPPAGVPAAAGEARPAPPPEAAAAPAPGLSLLPPPESPAPGGRVLMVARGERMTLRRYLGLARELASRGAETVLLSLAPDLPGFLAEEAARLGCPRDTYFARLDDFSSEPLPVPLVQAPYRLESAREASWRPRPGSLAGGTPSDLRELTLAAGFPWPRFLVGEIWDPAHHNLFVLALGQARNILDRLRPAAVLHDLEYLYPTLALLQEAGERGIPVYSLQHGGGYSRPYGAFPVMSSHYFAYSRHNQDTLAGMGVPPERVLASGAPETDLDPAAWRRPENLVRLRQELAAPPGARVVLVALRPEVEEVYSYFRWLNRRLIEGIARVFPPDAGYFFVLRCHPRDKLATLDGLAEFAARTGGPCRVLPAEGPLEEVLLVADALITFTSSAVVAALLQEVPVGVLVSHDGTDWPPYARHGAYPQWEIEEVEAMLGDLRQGRWPRPSAAAREAFLAEFDTRREPGNAARMAGLLLDPGIPAGAGENRAGGLRQASSEFPEIHANGEGHGS